MNRKEVLAARKQLEDFYYSCKFETPEEVAKQFEVYTKLIWNYHLAGLVYDYYSEETLLNKQGSWKMRGGVAVAENHTIPAFAGFPNKTSTFMDIFCEGNPEEGYRFGQIVTHDGQYSENGFSAQGRGTGRTFQTGEEYGFCQCVVKKVRGRWMITEEFMGPGEEAPRRWTADSRPFLYAGEAQTAKREDAEEPEETEKEITVEEMEGQADE